MRAERHGVHNARGRVHELERFAGLIQPEAEMDARCVCSAVPVQQQVRSSIQRRARRELELERHARIIAEAPAGKIDREIAGVEQFDQVGEPAFMGERRVVPRQHFVEAHTAQSCRHDPRP